MRRAVRIAVVAALVALGGCAGGGAKSTLDASGAGDQPTSTTVEPAAIAPTTTSPPTTAPAPTTRPRFSIRSVKLTMNTCTDTHENHGPSGATIGCTGHYVFTFNPGTAGDFSWRLTASNRMACNEPAESPMAERQTGTIHVADGMTQAAGDVEFYWENAPNPQTVHGAPPAYVSKANVAATSGAKGSSGDVPYYSDYSCP